MTVRKNHILSFLLLTIIFSLGFVFSTFSKSAQADLGLLQMQQGLDEIAAPYGDNYAKRDIRIVVANIIKEILGVLSLLFIGLIIFAGFKWMTAGGNEEKVKSASKLLSNAIVGLLIILASWGLSLFILKALRTATLT